MQASAEWAPHKKLAQKPLVTSQFISLAKTMSHGHPQLQDKLEKVFQLSMLLPSLRLGFCYEKGKGTLDME